MLVARPGCKCRDGSWSAEAREKAHGQVGGSSKSTNQGFTMGHSSQCTQKHRDHDKMWAMADGQSRSTKAMSWIQRSANMGEADQKQCSFIPRAQNSAMHTGGAQSILVE